MSISTTEIIALENAHQIPTYNRLPIALEKGEGVYVWDTEGKRYLDFYGGHCVALLGHAPPAVVRAVQEQAEKLIFYSNVVHHSVRAEAAALLASLAPADLNSVFFANSGAEANETALKLARVTTGKTGVIAMEQGFHGRTLGSLGVTGFEKYRLPHQEVLAETHFVPFGDIVAVVEVLEQHDDIAAVILEPIQSMAGVHEGPNAYYHALRVLCDEYRAKLIFDEVQTGVGRTGTFTMAEQIGVTPDLITLAKSLGAGVPVSAVLVSDAIAETVEYGDQGSTFGGGMLAMAAVKATLETLQDEGLMEQASEIFEQVHAGLSPHVKEVRGRGCLIGVELYGAAAPVLAELRENGVLAGGAAVSNVIRLMPPLNTPAEAIDDFLTVFKSVVTTSTTQAAA